MHHALMDFFSLGVMLRDLDAVSAHLQCGVPLKLQPLGLQYADFTLYQNASLENGPFESHLAFWRKQLAGGLGYMCVHGVGGGVPGWE